MGPSEGCDSGGVVESLGIRVPSNTANNVTDAAVRGAEEKDKHVSDSNPTEEDDSADEAEFKEGGYGWVVVASVLLVNAHTWGMNSAFAVFLAYYLHSGAFPGATPLEFAFVGGLSVAIAFIFSPIATVCIGRYGTNIAMTIGVIFETASFIGASFTTQIWQLLLSQGVCFGIGMGFCFTATVGVVPQWFVRQRSFASAVATSGSGFGGLTYALAANTMIERLGLAWTFRIFAIMAFVVNGICSWTIRDRNHIVGAVHVAFQRDLFARPEFLLFISWGFFSMLSYMIVIFSVADYAEQVGFSASQGSIASAMFNLSQGLFRPFIGLISDKFGRLNIAGFGTLLSALTAFFLWIFAGPHFAGLIIYVLFGVFSGILWPTVAPVGAEVVGIQLLPAALSITWLILSIPSLLAEVIALSLVKPGHGGYLSVQVFTGCMYIISFISLWILRSWKIHEMDALGLTTEEREADIRNADAVRGRERGGAGEEPGAGQGEGEGGDTQTREQSAHSQQQQPKSSIVNSYIRAMFSMQHV